MNAMLELKMNQGLLDCSYCHLPLRHRGVAGEGAFTCVAGHIYCGRNRCVLVHGEACRGGNIYCKLLLDTVSHIKVKCDCGRYIPYCTFLDHQHQCPWFLKHQRESSAKSSAPPPPMRKCILEQSCLLCAHCKAPLRPPLFRHCSRDLVVCGNCYGGNVATYRHCTQLEYLVQGLMLKCVECKQYLPFSTLALQRVEDCPFKHKLQGIAPGASAPKNCGKNKRKASIEVGEVEVGNEDESCDDNHENMMKEGLLACTATM